MLPQEHALCYNGVGVHCADPECHCDVGQFRQLIGLGRPPHLDSPPPVQFNHDPCLILARNCRFEMEQKDLEWELEEGIPQLEDPFIQQYLNGRDSLISEEQKQRHGLREPLL